MSNRKLYTEDVKGRLSTTITIWCGTCCWWEDLDYVKKRQCAEQARQRGWKLTKDAGWICPHCIAGVPSPENMK